MSNREEWVIKYIDSTLAAQWGCKPFAIGSRLARDYIDKGLAILVSAPPGANLSLPKDMDSQSRLVKMPEEENLTKIEWVCSTGYVDATLRKVGKSCGFMVNPMSATTFIAKNILKTDIMVIESNLRGYDTNQLLDLRAIQFHKKRPFIFRVIHTDNSEYFQMNLLHAKLCLFSSKKLFDYVSEEYGDSIQDWYIEAEGDYYKFWKKVDELIHPGIIQHMGKEEYEKSPLSAISDPNPSEGSVEELTFENIKKIPEMLPPPETKDVPKINPLRRKKK